MHHPEAREFLCEKFEASQVEQIVHFVDQGGGFSPNGELVIVSFFMYTQEAKKDFDKVLAACKTKHKTDWQYMHPQIRGDMEAPAHIGAKNRYLLTQLHEELGVPLPS